MLIKPSGTFARVINMFGRVTPEERLAAKLRYDAARNSEGAARLARYETRKALEPIAAALLQSEQDDGSEELDEVVELTEDDIETSVNNAAPDECPPTLRAGELYPRNFGCVA